MTYLYSPSLPELDDHLTDVQFRVFRRILKEQPLRHEQLLREVQVIFTQDVAIEKQLEAVLEHLQNLLLIERKIGAIKPFDEYKATSWGKMFADYKAMKY